MMKDVDNLILESLYSEMESENYIKVYHGGSKWTQYTAKISPPKKGRFQSGIGINTTTFYETARKYAKGNKVVSLIYVSKDVKLAENVNISLSTIIEFLNRFIGPKYRKDIIAHLQDCANRRNVDHVPANYLVNLFANYEIGGKQGLYLNDFLVENGVDASLYHQNVQEDWLIIHNTRIIKKVIHTKPNDIKLDDYVLPKISEQIK